jgi:hypothetical protein
MDKGTQIKTHFDLKVLLFLGSIFLLSCVLLAFKINTAGICTVNDFKVDAPSYKAGELITFSDVSGTGYEWKWDFNDGTNPVYRSKTGHSFSKPGKYNVKLLINNNCQVQKAITITPKDNVVNTALLPKFYAPKVVKQGERIQFKDSTANAKSWEWRFGDGSKIDAIDKDPVHIYTIPGDKVVSLVVNGDVKNVQFAKITVLPVEKQAKDIISDRIKRRNSIRTDPVEEYFRNIPDSPKPSAEIAGINEVKLEGLLMGASEGKLSYQNLIRYFCSDALPLVELRKGKMITLESLYKDIHNNSIKIKSIRLVRDKDECVNNIKINYKHRGLF